MTVSGSKKDGVRPEVVTVWWVRHGPTHQKAFTGWRDVPADLGDLDHVKRVDAHLPDDAVIVASDLRRASDTADAIGGNRKRLPNMAALREFDFGDWDGKRFNEVAESHPDLSRAYWETPGDIAPPNGESWNMAASRVNSAVTDLLRDLEVPNLIVVAHLGVIMTQIQRGTTGLATDAISHQIDPLSVTRIRFDGAWTVEAINHNP